MAQADILRAIMDEEFRAEFMKQHNLSEAEFASVLENTVNDSSPHFGII